MIRKDDGYHWLYGERYQVSIPTLYQPQKKGLPFGNPIFNLAEAQRFELWNPFGSPVFKTGAFNRSATLPE